MSVINTYVSTPGTLFSLPTGSDIYVYLLSSINPTSKEIIIRNTNTSPFIVSTTNGIRFSPSLSTQTLSSFTAIAPYSFISVVPRTPTEYILLEAPGFSNPQRDGRLDLAPNYLYLSTLSTLSLTASTEVALGDFTIGVDGTGKAAITVYPGATTAIETSTIQAEYISTGSLQINTVQSLAANLSTFTGYSTVALSTRVGEASTLTGTTVLSDASFQSNLTQTDGLLIGQNAFITVGGTAAFQSTIQANTVSLYGPTAGFGSTFNVVGTTTSTDTFSTLGSLNVSGSTRIDGNYQATALSTISYNALATTHPTRAVFGTSNTSAYTAYVQGTATTTGPFTALNMSSFTVSTAYGTYSTLSFLEGATPNLIYGSNGALLLNGTPITSGGYAPLFSTIITSNYTDILGDYRTSTLQVSLVNPTTYNVSSPQYTVDTRGNMYVSTAFVMDNLAVYGGTNPTLYATPAFNTLYASTNGLLINNRLFVDGQQNRVGVNTTAPAYTLDISAQLYLAATNAFNTGGTSWIIASDSSLKENITHIGSAALESYGVIIESLPLKQYRYKQDHSYYVDISREKVDENGMYILDQNGKYIVENTTVERTDIGFAREYGLGSAKHYGFIAQDVELFFPNSVYEVPFYKYDDFHFLTSGPIFNAQYLITRKMVSTVTGHSTIISHRDEFIRNVKNHQLDVLKDLSGAIGFPYNSIITGDASSKWSLSG